MSTKVSGRDKALFNRTLKSARLGLPDAQYEVGLMYANGVGVSQNLEQAITWIRQSAEKGFVSAQYLLATRYAGGIAIEKDEHKALVWYLKAADQGHPKAIFRLGKMYAAVHTEAAFGCYLKAAELGHPEAQLLVGNAYAAGQSVSQDVGRAFQWYLTAAEQGNAEAQCALADLYAAGRGVEQDVSTAFVWYRKAARQFYAPAQVAMEYLDSTMVGRSSDRERIPRKRGASERRRDVEGWENAVANASAQSKYYFGLMCELGLGVPQSDDLAETWYFKAALLDDVKAQLALAKMLEKRGDHSAVDWYTKAAEQGDVQSQCALGRILSVKPSGENESLQGAFWYSRAGQLHDCDALMALSGLYSNQWQSLSTQALMWAAEQGVAEAEFKLGQQYALGVGLKKDPAQAFDWFRRSAEQGHAKAQCALGHYYLEGRVVDKNLALAFTWLQRAADQGDAKAQWNVGSIFASGGDGVERDLRQAFLWCRKSADLGFVPAQATLGVLFARIKDYDQAAAWLEKAALQGDPEAQYNLALTYTTGQGHAPDPEQAFRWFYEAAQQGVASAQVRLGVMYATGDSVALDMIEAHKWFAIAANAGDEVGIANLARSEERLGLMQIKEATRRAHAWRAVVVSNTTT